MRNMILRRLGISLLVILAVSIVVFAASYLLPGEPPDEQVAQRYFGWLAGLFAGNFGTSTTTGAPVTDLLGTTIANSAVLLIVAAIIVIPVGVVLGIVSARRRTRSPRTRTGWVSLVLTTMPEFIVRVILLALFATSVFRILPAISPANMPVWAYPTQLILPLLTLVLVTTPYVVRATSSAMVEALASDAVEMARLKGAPERQVVRHHALPQTIGPVAKAIAIQLTWMVSGVIVVEYLFLYPGIGQTLIQAVTTRDMQVVQAIVLLIAVPCVLLQLLAQVIHIVATPRLRSTA